MPTRLFPARQLLPRTGYAGLAAPGLIRWLLRELPSFDVVHVHLARDLVTLPAARLATARGLPLVIQTHGMIDRSDHPLSRPLDAVLTVPVLVHAAQVFCLTPSEIDDLAEVMGTHRRPPTTVLPNGVPPTPASSEPRREEIVYLGRLAPRKRPVLFVDLALELLARGIDASFVLIGPDEGEGEEVRRRIANSLFPERISWIGSLPPDQVQNRLVRARLVVNTTDRERYGMGVLEGFSAGCPAIVGRSCGIADEIVDLGCGVAADESVAGYADAVEHLWTDPERYGVMSASARSAATHRYGMAPVVDQLETAYANHSRGTVT